RRTQPLTPIGEHRTLAPLIRYQFRICIGGVIAMNRLSRRLVYGCRGMICSNSPLAASAGLKVLHEGGNAFDAALAVAATEAVTIVPACGLGGDAFILLADAASRQIHRIQSSGGIR